MIEQVWSVVDQQFAAHLAAQQEWPEVTDSDRLTAAFRALDRARVVAREVFTCCQNCGHDEIGDEFSPGGKPRGYVFYHRQDAERGVAGEGVYLAYDGFDQLAVGQQIAQALREHGLQPTWDGSATTRIMVPMTWQRRRLGRDAAHPAMISGNDFPRTRRERRGMAGIPAPDKRRVGEGLNAVTASDIPWEPMLEVAFQYRGEVGDNPIPMTVAESLAVLSSPVRADSWATYTSRSGIVVKHRWDDGLRLRMELPDPAAGCSHGRYVTFAEAQQVITALAEHDESMLAQFGPLESRPR